MVKTRLVLLLASAVLVSCNHSFEWTKHVVDGHMTGVSVPGKNNVKAALGESDGKVYTAPSGRVFDGGATPAVAKIMIDTQPKMARVKEVIGHSSREMIKRKPESELSNWAVDNFLKEAAAITGKKIDVSMLNFGGMRTDMPKGDILLDDILSMFPFRNTIVCVTLRGKDLRALFQFLASTGPQPLGGARLEVSGKKLVKAEVNGKPIDDKKLYNVASIDFLLDGGDGVHLARNAVDVKFTGVLLKDAMVSVVRRHDEEGRKITYKKDGRYKILDK